MPHAFYVEYAQAFRSKMLQHGAGTAVGALIAVLLGWLLIFS